jgi:hypothetical protein
MWQQWQQLTAAAAARTEATAATVAASQQAAVGPNSKQAPQLPQQPQQQQQQQMPAYGSLEEEFSLLSSDAMCQWEDTWLMVNLTRKHLKRLKRRAMLEIGDQRPSSSSSSSEDSDTDDSSSGDSSSGDGEEDDSRDDGQCVFGQHLIEPQRRLRRASTIQTSMQACLGCQGFTELAELLQEVGEAIYAKVPVPWMCNNPGCTSMDGASELQLVGG